MASATTAFVDAGLYAGVFGDLNAEDVAGAVNLDRFDGASDPLGITNEPASSACVLDPCAIGAANPICAQLA